MVFLFQLYRAQYSGGRGGRRKDEDKEEEQEDCEKAQYRGRGGDSDSQHCFPYSWNKKTATCLVRT